MKENWGDTASDYSWPIVPVPGQLANDCNQPEAAIGRDGFAAIAARRSIAANDACAGKSRHPSLRARCRPYHQSSVCSEISKASSTSIPR